MKAPPLIKITKTRDRDPTLIGAKVRDFLKEIDRRFLSLKRQVRLAVVDRNILGGVAIPVAIAPTPLIPLQTLSEKPNYVYERSSAKAIEFLHWLDGMIADEILLVESRVGSFLPEMGSLSTFWADKYILSAYSHGMEQARKDLVSVGVELPPDMGPISVAFNRPFHADRIGLIYTRVFNEMKGVTETMKGQMSKALAEGMSEGRHPEQVSKMLADRIDVIGRTRARLIARTEMVQTHNESTLNEFNSLEGIVGEEIKVQWWTARDERVRPRHQERHGKIYTRKEALPLLGEPNCRCALLPWIDSIEEEREKLKSSL